LGKSQENLNQRVNEIKKINIRVAFKVRRIILDFKEKSIRGLWGNIVNIFKILKTNLWWDKLVD
jgi:hypothetical protein